MRSRPRYTPLRGTTRGNSSWPHPETRPGSFSMSCSHPGCRRLPAYRIRKALPPR